MDTSTTSMRVLGPDGSPADQYLASKGDPRFSADGVRQEFVAKTFAEFMRNIATTSSETSESRASRAFQTHAWVYAASMAIAVQFSQAPFLVYQETPDQIASRKAAVVRSGLKWAGPRAGDKRTAALRHLRAPARMHGMKLRGAEPFFDHPLMQVLQRPNRSMSGREIWLGTAILMSMRGEAFWHLITESGMPYMPGETVSEIKLYSPDWMNPIYQANEIVGWRVSVPRGMGKMLVFSLLASEVMQFKYWNPYDPTRGMSPITAAASSIEIDILAQKHTRGVLVNQATPRGVLADKSVGGKGGLNATERKEAQEWFRQRYQGVDAAGSVLVLPGDLEFLQMSLTPADMEYVESRKWGRAEIAAVLRVPLSALSVTDSMNYSVQISQDRNFWRNGILPLMGIFEDVIDSTLLFPETDNIFGAFDLSGVEALRAGLSESVATVERLCGDKIHMPPHMAFEVVGIDIPPYVGDQDALVAPLLGRVTDVLQSSQDSLAQGNGPTSAQPGAAPVETPAAVGDGATADNPGAGSAPKPAKSATLPGSVVLRGEIAKLRSLRFWRSIITEVEEPGERLFMRSWRAWTALCRRKQLKQFDEAARGKTAVDLHAVLRGAIEPDKVVLDLQAMQNDLAGLVAPVYPQLLDATLQFTIAQDLGGVAAFHIDDPRLMEVMTKRQSVLLGTAPETLQKNMRASLRAGIDAGETVSELRIRISNVYDVAASSSKTLQVARTESAGFMNAARDEVFDIVKAQEQEWTTAGDEQVRESHRIYGGSGPHPRGFNFLSLSPNGEQGQLLYPNDDRAPAGEVINCRCVAIMVK